MIYRSEQQLHCKNLKHLCQYTCVLSTHVHNRSAFEVVTGLCPNYAGNFPYYAGIMLYAFQPVLCLKLCWHNRLRSISW